MPAVGVLGGLTAARRSFGEFRRTIVWALIVEQKAWFGLLLLTGLAVFGVIMTMVEAIRDAIDLAVIEQTEPLRRYVDALLVLAILGLLAGFALRMVLARIAYTLEYDVRLRLYRKLLGLDPRAFDSLATGQLVTRAVSDLFFLEIFVLIIPGFAVIAVILLALAIVVIAQSLPMAILALAAIPVNGWIVLRVRHRLLGMSWVSLNRRAEVTTAIDEAVRGIRVVKSFGREAHERETVRSRALAAYGVALNRVRLLARLDLFLRAVPTLLNAGQLVLAGRLLGEHFTIGRLLILLVYARVFTEFAQSFNEIANAWMLAKAGASRITELLELEPGTGPRATRPLPPPAGGLRFEAAAFEPEGAPVLRDLHLAVGPGQLVVVHGRPGSGKTVLASLAGGGLSPTSGRVVLDGADLADLDLLDVRRAVRVLGEEPFLFGRTVRENLTIGQEGAVPDERLWGALAAAAADGFVRDLAAGLDTVLGDRGMTLSGGQRQRLALARALVAPPRVLVLDDALSAVNPALELEIMQRLRALAPNTGVLCITRREGLGRVADDVVALPDPRPVDRPEVTTTPQTVAGPLLGNPMVAEAMGALSGMVDVKMLQAIASVPEDRDLPPVPEEAATDSDHPPTVLRILRPMLPTVLLGAALLLGVTGVGLVPEGLFKIAVDDFRDGGHHQADRVALVIAGIALVVGVLQLAFRMTAGRVNEGAMYLLRRQVFQRLSRLGIDFYDRELPGRVAARVVYDLDRIWQFLDNGLYQITVNVTLMVVALGVILVWSPPVFFAVAPLVVLMLAATGAQVPVADRAYNRQRSAVGTVVERLQEDMAGRYLIDAYGARAQADAAFAERALELKRARRWSAVVAAGYVETMIMLGSIAAAALIWRAGNLALAGTISVGAMVSLQLYLNSAVAPVQFMAEAVQRLMAARASLRTLRQPFGEPILPPEREDAEPCGRLEGHVRLEGVGFAYPGTQRRVLHDVDLDLPAGTAVAVVGPTGAGKSSIAKLIARIYDPDQGAVRVDGRDLRELRVDDYRRRLGIVPQDAFCFRGTVRSNIAYGRPDATDEEIEAAIDEVGARDVLAALPDGLRTVVEEEGRNLTAAQRQVVALARAVLPGPDLLILDEATSSLDPEHEAAVLDAVGHLGRTTVFITHRLPVAQRADMVVVVDGGRIAEQGRHDELMAAGGAYAALWAAGPEVGADEVAGVTTPAD